MYKIFFFVVFSFSALLMKSQVNPEFRQMKEKFQQHRLMLETEFNKRQSEFAKNGLADFVDQQKSYFMKKLDSVENAALVGVLVKVKNLEDLSKVLPRNSIDSKIGTSIGDAEAKYPGGITAIRNFISENIYTENINTEELANLTTKVRFVVERDGSVSQVKASGDSASLNRQSEIVLYLLPEKFSPAQINGTPVRSYYSIPITIAKN